MKICERSFVKFPDGENTDAARFLRAVAKRPAQSVVDCSAARVGPLAFDCRKNVAPM
jgi:hypothetical protein